jgi:hypothetical protein
MVLAGARAKCLAGARPFERRVRLQPLVASVVGHGVNTTGFVDHKLHSMIHKTR